MITIKNFLLRTFLLSQFLFSDIYDDRIRVYVKNSHDHFEIISDKLSNNDQLNSLMLNSSVKKIEVWLPNAKSTDRDGEIYLNRYFMIYFQVVPKSIELVKKEFSLLDCIDHVELVTVDIPTYIPNDPYWNSQYGLELIQADLAFDLWDINTGSMPGEMTNEEIVVAIVDNSLEWDHPDLVDNIWQNIGEDADGDGAVIIQSGNSWIFDPGDANGIDDDGDGFVDNFIGWDVSFDDNDPMPPNNQYSHGTAVAGCVSSSTNNNIGIASVGWSIKLMGINSTDDPGFVTDGYSGMLVAGQMGADVINLSWGGYGGGNQSVINSVYNNYGSIIVASAGNGNNGTNFDFFSPAGLNNVVSVSAVGPNDNFNCWATAGSTVDLCAPGENILTTSLNANYGSYQGTSFSSPITAGAIALVWSKFPDAGKEWIIDRIISSTDEFPDMTGSCAAGNLTGMLGSGRLNVNNALSGGVFPNLFVADVNYLNDTDDDGVFNPGEEVKVKLLVGNQEGWADGENVVATLSTDDDRIIIIDDTMVFTNNIPSGTTTFTLFDHFLVYAHQDAQLGEVPCKIHLQAGAEEPYYETEIDIEIVISLDQYGFEFPTPDMVLKSSPIITDLYGNAMEEVFVGGDNGNLYGFMIGGNPLTGFPFNVGGKIRSSPAIGDVDNDGSKEVIFGSHDGGLYVISVVGTQEIVFSQNGYIVGSPAIFDMDDDGDMEIAFTTQIGIDSGEVFLIHHDGVLVEGFPVDIGERMMVGPAIGDLEQDGALDIVVCTWEDKVYAIDFTGSIKSGFPFVSTNRFNSPPTLVDLNEDGNLEIIVGNDSGLLHVLYHNGSELSSFDFGDDIRGGISVSDLDFNGSYEVLFSGYDDFLHVIDPITGQEMEGWPVDLGSNSLSEPITADLDGDGDLEIIGATKNGDIFVFHHNGTYFNHFPINVDGYIESSPAIGDIDNDGDYEFAVATTNGLKVIDIKTVSGNQASWKTHRGNPYRTGLFTPSSLSLENKNIKTNPEIFSVTSNFPNPFNPTTKIRYKLPEDALVNIVIYDVMGRNIRNLMNLNQTAGYHSIRWDAKNDIGEAVAAGMYIYTIQAGDNRATRKMVLLK